MDKDPQPTGSHEQTESPKKPSKPWPMWWVIAFVAVYIAIYTFWRLK
ncbi:hypothetical protein F7C95_10595 [Opitutia bacterium ISCC 51]|nr:hypothetical protein [bacterium]MDG2169170.1 hypothetical protein [Opitutales bacterium]QXD22406.1 hypothetical protein F7C95_10595 [Opitutae bacterium ISCC 51]QXD26487.1 hypothetical protein GA003_10530 [Opitutae bacterium ISCC 52]